MVNEGGLSSVKDLIEVVTELENSSECASARNSQVKQNSVKRASEEESEEKKHDELKVSSSPSEESAQLIEDKQLADSITSQLHLQEKI